MADETAVVKEGANMEGLNTFTTALSIVSTLCAIIFGYAAFSRSRNKDTKEEVEARAAALSAIRSHIWRNLEQTGQQTI